MSALSFDTTTRDRVAVAMFKREYASCQSHEQAVIDNAGASVLATINQIAQHFDIAASGSETTDAWTFWLQAAAEAAVARSFFPDLVADRAREAAEKRETALSTFRGPSLTAANTAGSLDGLTLETMRKVLVVRLARQGVMCHTGELDGAVLWAANDIWNARDWLFKLEQTTLTLADAASTITSTDYDAIRSERLLYAGGDYQCVPVTGAEMTQLLAGTPDAGRPRYYRAERVGPTLTIRFERAADQEYTLYAEMVKAGPPEAAASDQATPFADFPPDFLPVLTNRAAAKILADRGARGAGLALSDSNDEVNRLLPKYEQVGVNAQPAVRDVYGDMWRLAEDTVTWLM